MTRLALIAPLGLTIAIGAAHAAPLVTGGKLPLTRGATSIEGAAGAGLATWGLIAGQETEDGVGATAFYTAIPLSDYSFEAYGASLGLFDRLELSYARQEFDTGSTGAALGLGEGFTLAQDVYGVKLRLFGDAVYDQDKWVPQVAVGAQYKQADHKELISALGGEDDESVDLYLSATKIVLAHSLVLSGAVRWTEANQFGLLGFGGDRKDTYTTQFEATAAYMPTDRIAIGGEYRTRPDNLGFAKESDAFDVFAAYAVTDNLTLVAGYVDLGEIATFDDQRGAYLSLQVGF
jgi:hypothetical protein